MDSFRAFKPRGIQGQGRVSSAPGGVTSSPKSELGCPGLLFGSPFCKAECQVQGCPAEDEGGGRVQLKVRVRWGDPSGEVFTDSHPSSVLGE